MDNKSDNVPVSLAKYREMSFPLVEPIREPLASRSEIDPDCRILPGANAIEQSLVFARRGSDSGKIILFPFRDLAT